MNTATSDIYQFSWQGLHAKMIDNTVHPNPYTQDQYDSFSQLLACASAMVQKCTKYDPVLSAGPRFVEFFHQAWQKPNQHFPIGFHPPCCAYRSMRNMTPFLSTTGTNPPCHLICLPPQSSLPLYPYLSSSTSRTAMSLLSFLPICFIKQSVLSNKEDTMWKSRE